MTERQRGQGVQPLQFEPDLAEACVPGGHSSLTLLPSWPAPRCPPFNAAPGAPPPALLSRFPRDNRSSCPGSDHPLHTADSQILTSHPHLPQNSRSVTSNSLANISVEIVKLTTDKAFSQTLCRALHAYALLPSSQRESHFINVREAQSGHTPRSSSHTTTDR